MFYRKFWSFATVYLTLRWAKLERTKAKQTKVKTNKGIALDGFESLNIHTTSEQNKVVCRDEWLSRPRYLPQSYLRLRHSFSLHNLFNLFYPKYPYFSVNVRCFDLSMTYKNAFNRYICIPLQNVCLSSILKRPPVRARNDVSTSLCKLTNRWSGGYKHNTELP